MQSESESAPATQKTFFGILIALGVSHMVNDTLQSLLPSIYPILKKSFSLTYTQVGLITLSFQLTASLLQPMVGRFTDRHPKPYSLAVGMGMTLVGLVFLSRAGSYPMILFSSVLVGMGSSIFHPEASRVAHMAAGDRHGLAQSVFQTGGNLGSSLGPLLAALIIAPNGQSSILWFTAVALGNIAWGHQLAQAKRWFGTAFGEPAPATSLVKPDDLPR